jgi:hypothetical protein
MRTFGSDCLPKISPRSNGRCHNEDHALESKLRAHCFQQRRQFHTAAGILVVESSTHDEGTHIFDQSLVSSLALRISFLPKMDLSSVSVIVSFSKQFGADMKPNITRLVQAYNIIPRWSAAFLCAENNDAPGLQKLFTTGESSPYDCDEYGHSLLIVSTYSYLIVRLASFMSL